MLETCRTSPGRIDDRLESSPLAGRSVRFPVVPIVWQAVVVRLLPAVRAWVKGSSQASAQGESVGSQTWIRVRRESGWAGHLIS
jgi:hypothetical protein